MFYIRKYSDCWAIHDDDTGASRPLKSDEVYAVKEEFPGLAEDNVKTIFTDMVTSIEPGLPA